MSPSVSDIAGKRHFKTIIRLNLINLIIGKANSLFARYWIDQDLLFGFLARCTDRKSGQLSLKNSGNRGRLIVTEDMNMLALVKGEEKYVFLFNDKNRSATLRQLGKYASDPDLSFTWYDAAVLSQKIRAAESENVSRIDSDSLFEAADSTDPEDLFNF